MNTILIVQLKLLKNLICLISKKPYKTNKRRNRNLSNFKTTKEKRKKLTVQTKKFRKHADFRKDSHWEDHHS